VERTRIKICGITRVQDALAAAEAGADAIGLVFYPPAPRYVRPDLAAQIVAALPPFITPVGLFVDAPAAEILATAAKLGLRTVQLNGHEGPELIAALHGVAVLKAIHVTRANLATDLQAWRRQIASHGLTHLRGLVLETGSTPAPGGTGIENDWEAIAAAGEAGAFASLPPSIAAGGLTPGNVAGVVRLLRPWAVDISSGVEDSPGQKSAQKIRDFVTAVCTASTFKAQ
jgi:phosphoribosylanthranilate isomerase